MTKPIRKITIASVLISLILLFIINFLGDRIVSGSGFSMTYNPNNHEFDIVKPIDIRSQWGYTIENIEVTVGGFSVVPHFMLIHHYTPEQLQAPSYPHYPNPEEGVEAVGYVNAWISREDYQWIGLRVSGQHEIDYGDTVEIKIYYRFFWLHKQHSFYLTR